MQKEIKNEHVNVNNGNIFDVKPISGPSTEPYHSRLKPSRPDTWTTIKRILKHTGMALCVILIVVFIIIGIKSKSWPSYTTVAPLSGLYFALDNWDV